jgi:hypothetical protein
MKFIKLTTTNNDDLFVNIEHIGHIYPLDNGKGSRVGVTTHNNGGFAVKQTHDEIMQLMQEIVYDKPGLIVSTIKKKI